MDARDSHAWARRCRSLGEHVECADRRLVPTLRLLLLIILANVPSSTALALYPDRPVTIVVPFAPGGANDIVVRIIQQPLADALGQPIVVENRGGAGGNIAFAWVARARPDGYTLLLAPNSFAVNPSLYDKVAYDPFRDFEPVAEISSFPVMFAVRAGPGRQHAGRADRAREGEAGQPQLRDAGTRHACRIWRPSCSSNAPASTWCTFPMRARRRPPRRSSARPSTSARCRSRSPCRTFRRACSRAWR